MKNIILVLLCSSMLFAKGYKATIAPYESATISAEASGKIVKLDQEDELTLINKEVLIIDNALESAQLSNFKTKLSQLSEQLRIKEEHYENILKLSGKSQREKENYLIELLNMKMQLSDLKNSIATLEDVIRKKHLKISNRYLKRLYVREGEYVNMGTKLLSIEDHSKSRVVIYVDQNDHANIHKKSILINGKSDHNYKISKVSNSTDEEYISMYRVELICDGASNFGEVVTIEIKE